MTTFKTLSLFTIAIFISGSLQTFKPLFTKAELPIVTICRDFYTTFELGEDTYTKKWFVNVCHRYWDDKTGYEYTIEMKPFFESESFVKVTFFDPIDPEERDSADMPPKIETITNLKFDGEKSNPEWADQVSEDGLITATFKTCELSLDKTDLEDFPYLKDYLIISCQQNKDNSDELHMVLVQKDFQSLRHTLVSKSEDGENFKLIKHEYDFKSVQEQQEMFEYKDSREDVSQCEEAITKLSKEDLLTLEDSEILQCRTQLVAGKWFRMIMMYHRIGSTSTALDGSIIEGEIDMRPSIRAKVDIFMSLPEDGQEPVYKIERADIFYSEPMKYHPVEFFRVSDPPVLDCFEPIRQIGRQTLDKLLSYKLTDCQKDEFEENRLIVTLKNEEKECKIFLDIDEESKPTLVKTEENEDCFVMLED